MKKLLTVIPALMLLVTVQAFSGWQFVKVFPDTSISFGTGLHGIAVDAAGKIWVAPGGTAATDTLPNGTRTAAIYVFNPNGTEAAFSRIKIITTGSVKDTLTALCRGMRTAPDGNIVYVGIGGQVFKIDYKTGLGIQKLNPTSPAVTAGIAPAFTSANEMFTGHVLPGNPIKIWDNSFGGLGTAVPLSLGFSRTMEVSKDGNNIFWCGYSTKRIYVYHSDLGTLGTYTLTDSLAIGMQAESAGWHKQSGLLYVSAGTMDTTDYGAPPVDPPWTPMRWYGFDVATKTVKDSITWNSGAYPYTVGAGGTLFPRPRGHDFSVTGDTAYVICYNHAKAAMQMFKKTATSVEPVSNVVPSGYTLSQNFPNPFNPATQIEFAITKAGMTTLKVYDMLGKEVATLVDENLAPGSYKSNFDASRLSSGTYIYTLTSGGTRMSKKMLLVK